MPRCPEIANLFIQYKNIIDNNYDTILDLYNRVDSLNLHNKQRFLRYYSIATFFMNYNDIDYPGILISKGKNYISIYSKLLHAIEAYCYIVVNRNKLLNLRSLYLSEKRIVEKNFYDWEI